ncbi:MAG: hypothetical protein ACFFC6_16010, partial [Promethearchaeota archaeon]
NRKMKKKISVLVLSVFILILLPAISVNAKKPSSSLRGTMTLDFDLTATWPEDPVWVGWIDIDGYDEYYMEFYHLTPFKDYSQASPFEERFYIYDSSGAVLLAGPDVGVTILANKPPEPTKYLMNGEIDIANGIFSEWLGRNVHMSGVITWQVLETPDGTVIAPATAPGIFRIN